MGIKDKFLDLLTRKSTKGAKQAPVADATRVDEYELRLAETYFDRSYYISANSDVGDSGVDPLRHFLIQGWREGRNPSHAFDVNFYQSNNADVAAAGVNPLLHYLMAGRAEGRLPRDLLAGWRRQLDSARPPSQRPQWDLVDPRVLETSLSSREDLIARMVCSSAASGLVVSISHDDYARNFGGVQNIINDEQKAFNQVDWNYLHVSPAKPLMRLADRSNTLGEFIVSLRLDGTFVGYASIDDLIAAIQEAATRFANVEFIVHHLMGFSPELICKLLAAATIEAPVVWIHDLFTLCESYTLLRNDIVFCGGPPVDSMACGVCCYGGERPAHYERIRDFFEKMRPFVLAPSKDVLARWCSFGLPHRSSFVVPPARLVLIKCELSTADSAQRKLRIAHIGQRLFHKGWLVFQELALQLASDDRYEFVQLGLSSDVALPGCIRHIEVRVGPDDRNAMIHALAAAHIDVVVLWSLWPETFSYAAHEALAAGAFIVTRTAAGNIGPMIEANAPGQGIELPGQPSLLTLFETGEIMRLVAESTRRHGAVISGGGTADWLESFLPGAAHRRSTQSWTAGSPRLSETKVAR